MPYLSRIWLNPLRTGAQRLLRNPQAMHAAVLGGLARQPVTERVLWRLDTDQAHRAELLVLTASTPSWEHLIEQAGWHHADVPQALVRDYQPLLERLELGREFRFRLRANPVSSTRTPKKPSPAQAQRLSEERPRGVRVPHRTAAHQLHWLTERVVTWGFELPTDPEGQERVRLGARERLAFPKSAGAGRQPVVVSTATFDGVLRVTDPARARDSLLCGVGPARAYGCGLITLAPLTPTEAGGG
jgi:CRISPR system Cascade subunit CasE